MNLYQTHKRNELLKQIRKNDRKVEIWKRQRYAEANKGIII